MRIVVLAPGSRGDVQPHIALARALVERGHSVALVADPAFRSLAERSGVDLVAADFDIRSVLLEEQERFARAGNPLALLRGLSSRSTEMARAWGAAAIPIGLEADLIVAAGGAIYIGLSIAERAGIGVMQTMLQPFFPTRAFPSPIVRPADWPGPVNLLSHHAMFWLFHAMFRQSSNLVRRELGLAAWPIWPPRELRRPRYRALCAVSPIVVPPPEDLPANVDYSGYWFLGDRSNWTRSPALAAFLAAGKPPIYVGFGSIVDRDAHRSTALILAALESSGERAIVARGWGAFDLPADHPSAFAIDEAPHDRLLPLCSGIVHHGGAGTTGAALQAGLPQVIVPHMADQPFWADRMARLGVAAEVIPRPQLTGDRLCTALVRMAEDRNLRQRAEILAERLAAEDGLAAAVAQIEASLSQTRRASA